ncbi:hypothetical protein ACH49O_27380 [Streptomyces coeruleorubidus]|uniref:hypothetical protein n=1 Tax=Streptomyces coeruleorubidus TaxID=116188 RepID=UPI0033D5943C
MHQHQPPHRRRPHGHPCPALATATGPATPTDGPTGGPSVPATGTATHRDSAPQACPTA